MNITEVKDNNYLVIHYTGSNLFNIPFKIACITILAPKSSTKKTFSLSTYQNEELLLKDFLKKIQKNKLPIITWNMKDSTFGIEHILNRNQELGNKSVKINRGLFIDLDKVLEEKYNLIEYIPHKKLQNLALVNNIHLQGYIDGKEEAEYYESSEFRKIEVSCNRKVAIINEIFEKYRNNTLIIQKMDKVLNNDNISALQDFLSSVLAGNNPKLSADVISLLKQPKNENLWLEKKLTYSLSSEGEWTEFYLDILSASNAITTKVIGIFIGVDDNTGTFQSVTLPDEALIGQKIKSVITPELNYVIQVIKYPDNCLGYVLAIKPNKNVYSIKKQISRTSGKKIDKGSIWIRDGSGKIEVNRTDFNSLVQKKIQLFIEATKMN